MNEQKRNSSHLGFCFLTEFCLAFADKGLIVRVLPDAYKTESLSADHATEYTGSARTKHWLRFRFLKQKQKVKTPLKYRFVPMPT
jgi:hypothetical protein